MNEPISEAESHRITAKWTKHLAIATIALVLITMALEIWKARADEARDQHWHDTDKARQSVQLVVDLNKELAQFRERLIKAFPEMYRSSMKEHPMSAQEAEDLYLGCDERPGSESCQKKGTASAYLNLLEQIALANDDGLVDQKVVDELFSAMIVDDYHYLENFVREVEHRRYNDKRRAWPVLQQYVEKAKQSPLQKAM